MAFIILANALLGIAISLLYYPGSPIYLFPGANLEELWLWSKYSAFLGALLFIFALLAIDNNARGKELARSLSVFTSTLQGLMNLLPSILYIIFLHGAVDAGLSVRGHTITISSRELVFHVIIILTSWASATWLIFGERNRVLARTISAVDTGPYPGEGIQPHENAAT